MRILHRSACAVLLLVLAAGLFAVPAWAAVTATGNLSVISTPSGANISVDGIAKGRTPVTLAAIIPGAHSIVFRLAGYQALNKSVTVTAGQTTNVTGTLPLIPTTGKIAVTSVPTGANISLDGIAKGKTPVTLAGIKAGAHRILFTRAGYQTLNKSVTVTAGKTVNVTGTLIPATGTIAVTSVPTGANISLDGIAKGKTPVTLAGIKAGAHRILFTRAGYQTLNKSVMVTAGKTVNVTGTLAALGPISLQGVQSVTVSAARMVQGANMHHYDYTDSTGTVWGGIPLWYLVGFMDDTAGAPTGSHGSSTFNATKAASGYTVTVTGKSGNSASFTSQAVAMSNAYLVANTMNGVPITTTDPKGPYKLVGTGVTAAKSINGIVTIRMV